MQKWMWLPIVSMLALLLAACGGAETASVDAAVAVPIGEDSDTAATLSEEYEDAANLRSQLALGTLRLEGTPRAITASQAQALLPLWQTLQALGDSSTSAPEEVEAVLDQITASLSEEQVSAIAGLHLTNADLQAYYVEIGVSVVKTPEPGVTPQSGAFKDLPPEQREAARATAEALGTPVGSGRSSGTSKGDALLDKVIELLMERAGEA